MHAQLLRLFVTEQQYDQRPLYVNPHKGPQPLLLYFTFQVVPPKMARKLAPL